MGDRTTCRLYLHGILDQLDVPRLAEAISDASGDTQEDIIKIFSEGFDEVEFYDMNYGNLDTGLENLLLELKLSYSWEWDSGDEYAAGVHCYNALTREHSGDWSRASGELVLTIQEAETPGKLDIAKEWEEFWHKSRDLVIVTSNHHMMELAAAGKLPEGFLELHAAQNSQSGA